ncbi:MAG: WbqC family protein [Archaeoglobus sp.]|nr:WbqC family protein [Archaeoglobus sp.]
MTVVAIHQPNYLPYIGFFQKMAVADIFVILDVVQFSKDSYTQRTKIRTKDSWMWLTIPVEKKYYFNPIEKIYLPEDNRWMRKHKMSIISNYNKTFIDRNFVEQYYGDDSQFNKLSEFNEFGIRYLSRKLGINTDFIRSSELDIDRNLKSTELLVNIIKEVGGDVYVSGVGGKRYMDINKFERENIEVIYLVSRPVVYKQRWDGFEPFMSAIDLLFNLGKKAREFLMDSLELEKA